MSDRGFVGMREVVYICRDEGSGSLGLKVEVRKQDGEAGTEGEGFKIF